MSKVPGATVQRFVSHMWLTTEGVYGVALGVSVQFIFLFVLWHLSDLTWGFANNVGVSAADGRFVRGDAYGNVVRSFERVPVSVLYIVANIALGIHLFHGVWSLFQSMGWNNPRFNKWRRQLATAIATIIVVGNVSLPIAVLAGIVGK